MASSKLAAGDSGCMHYKRQCRLESPCCKRIYTCRFCHDENERGRCIRFNRFDVQLIICAECKTKQRVGSRCMSCGVTFGRAYFCVICRLYDNEDKQQFHCAECGICRIGGRENYYHCSTCGMCFPLSVKGNHRCRRDASSHNCMSCHEDLHTSTIPVAIPRCGHLIHKTCYEDLLQHDIRKCRLCKADY